MSIVGFNNINFAVNIRGALKAGDILNELNQGVTDSLRQHRQVSAIRDGMDIALCCFDFNNGYMSFAGANNPMLLVRNGEGLMYEPTKAPIGAFVGETLPVFNNNDIQIQRGDVVYVFSDGYADQFGGPDNKKFLKRHLREYLSQISHLPMNEQKAMLDQNFEQWRGDNEQIDDILIIGVRYV
jgi:serine phosphatase RsbU (regulator of sigma subunit)